MSGQLFACFAFVSAFYHLPPNVLPAIQQVEGGRPGLSAVNKDGSVDLGVMQINSRWIAPLAKNTKMSESTIQRRLLNEPCFNIATAGAIMRIYLKEEKGDLMRAIGDYHSHKPVRNLSYQLKVLAAAQQLLRRRAW